MYDINFNLDFNLDFHFSLQNFFFFFFLIKTDYMKNKLSWVLKKIFFYFFSEGFGIMWFVYYFVFGL